VRFLIDECLHTSLTGIANNAGHEAHHVTRRGWSGFKDHQLREVILQEEFVFVTNNARDFRGLLSNVELHPGLVLIIPRVTPKVQCQLFERALLKISRITDMINRVVEIDLKEIRTYPLPKLE
jgi:predicted nuclease of predicted toxin-antitoxin system